MYFFKNGYLIAGAIVYFIAVSYLHFGFEVPVAEVLPVFFILGVGFSFIAWWFTKGITQSDQHLKIENEARIIAALVLWIAFYITYGGSLINKVLPAAWMNNVQLASIIIFIKKLLVFVVIPFFIYKTAGFTMQDFGLRNNRVSFFDKKSLTVFIILSVAVLFFQYFLSNGGKQLKKEHFNIMQFAVAIPLCFVYLLFDAGLIEEFFFRGMLQSRLSVLLKSNTGGIIISAIIFGLVHAPGLYLRGAESEGMSEQMPFAFWSAYTIVYMSVAGVFLGVIYSRTKNLWLVMAIHAIVDLIPNLPEFIDTWRI